MEEAWIKQYWRPAMAWQYLVVCVFDFMAAPIMTGIFFYVSEGTYIPWSPITLQSGGFYHISMAGIIGIAAWTRGMEKLKRLQVDTDLIEKVVLAK